MKPNIAHISLLALFGFQMAVCYSQGLPEAPRANSETLRGILGERQTQIELSAVALGYAMDGITTRQTWERCRETGWICHEVNPGARWAVHSDFRTGLLMAGNLGAVIGGNWLLRHHPRWRHALNWSQIASEAFWTGFTVSHNR